ncbi:hypothetical protein BDQ17DRAFT_1382842, partial [Cyathus striatus]
VVFVLPFVFLPVTHSFSLFHLFVYFVYTLPLPLSFSIAFTTLLSSSFSASFSFPSLSSSMGGEKAPDGHHNIKYPVRFRPGVQLVETKLRLIVLPPANDSETHHVVSNTMESTDSLTLRREAMVEWCSTARISELHCSR